MKINQLKNNTLLFKLIYMFLVLILFISFFHSISKTNNINLVPSCLFKQNSQEESTANVGTFITDNTSNVNSELLNYFNELFETRNQSFITGDVTNLYKYYDTSQTYSKYSLLYEFKRIAYLRDWGGQRNIDFSTIKSYPKINDVKAEGSKYTVTLTEEYEFKYYYKDAPTIKNDFGVALFHNIDLQRIGDTFIIIKDYYLDCFEKGLDNYDFTLKEKHIPLTKSKTYNINFTRENNIELENNNNTINNYDREGAVNYANEYCGISWVNDSYHNNNYYEYVSSCGNCTNFVSQCLADINEGGKLLQDKKWRYSTDNDDIPTASESWVYPEKLIDYLISSNKALVSVRGNFNNLYKYGYFTSPQFASVQKGDLISYKKNNQIQHNAVITDFDSKGYPLINANSINKYKMPFDLGWSNDNVSFDIISIIN